LGSCFPTLAAKARTRLGWGTHSWCWIESERVCESEWGFVLSHPSRRSKNAARMGHPFFVLD
jgi:hypothetical protein